MPKDILGKKIRILEMQGESQYAGKEGIVQYIDDIGQLHGTWGGCAVIPGVDSYAIIGSGGTYAKQRKSGNIETLVRHFGRFGQGYK